MPPHLWPEIEAHLSTFVGAEPTALVFTKASGVSMDRTNFHTMWRRPTRAAGVPDYHFHDLRHLAATMAAVTGATTRELEVTDLPSYCRHPSLLAAMTFSFWVEVGVGVVDPIVKARAPV
jgi:integrase